MLLTFSRPAIMSLKNINKLVILLGISHFNTFWLCSVSFICGKQSQTKNNNQTESLEAIAIHFLRCDLSGVNSELLPGGRGVEHERPSPKRWDLQQGRSVLLSPCSFPRTGAVQKWSFCSFVLRANPVAAGYPRSGCCTPPAPASHMKLVAALSKVPAVWVTGSQMCMPPLTGGRQPQHPEPPKPRPFCDITETACHGFSAISVPAAIRDCPNRPSSLNLF